MISKLVMFDTALLWLITTDSLAPPATCLDVKFHCGRDSHKRWLPASISVSSYFIYASNRWFCLNLQNKILSLCAASNFKFHQSGLYWIVYWYLSRESKCDWKVKAMTAHSFQLHMHILFFILISGYAILLRYTLIWVERLDGSMYSSTTQAHLRQYKSRFLRSCRLKDAT